MLNLKEMTLRRLDFNRKNSCNACDDKNCKSASSYLTGASYEAIVSFVSKEQKEESCYFTMDAGPNVRFFV